MRAESLCSQSISSTTADGHELFQSNGFAVTQAKKRHFVRHTIIRALFAPERLAIYFLRKSGVCAVDYTLIKGMNNSLVCIVISIIQRARG